MDIDRTRIWLSRFKKLDSGIILYLKCITGSCVDIYKNIDFVHTVLYHETKRDTSRETIKDKKKKNLQLMLDDLTKRPDVELLITRPPVSYKS